MKDIIDTVVTSILAAFPASTDWEVCKYDPIWKDERRGPQLYVYGQRRRPGEYRTTQTREDIYELVIEYVEPAVEQTQSYTRNEANELAMIEFADDLVAWADGHQLWAGGTAHRFDWIATEYPADVRRELGVRFFRLRLEGRRNSEYV